MADISTITVNNTTYNINDATARNIHGIPTGGSAGQVLKKSSATNYDAAWATLSYLTDAPSDNGYYVRRNGAWVALSSLDGTGF